MKRRAHVPFEFIATPAALRDFCARLAPSGPVAIDTEFVGEKTYRPVLELVQVRDVDGLTGLVDAQALPDLGELAAVLTDKSRLKILHAGGQDIPILESAMGAPPWPIFDTQLAAAMVGLGAQVSYANLVSELAGASLGKKHTVSDWSRRPLSADQLEYAALDVAHLHVAHARLQGRLDALGRSAWFDEEQRARFEDARRSTVADLPPEEFHRSVKEWAKLRGRKLAILRELALWREEVAREMNLPRRVVMPDSGLVHLAQFAPTTREQARDLRQVPPGPLNKRLDEILAVVARGLALPKDKRPRKPPTERMDTPPGLVELVASLVRTIAEEWGIASTLIATTSEMNDLVNNRRRLREVSLPVLKGWRREMVGEQLMGLLEGRLAVYIADGERLAIEER